MLKFCVWALLMIQSAYFFAKLSKRRAMSQSGIGDTEADRYYLFFALFCVWFFQTVRTSAHNLYRYALSRAFYEPTTKHMTLIDVIKLPAAPFYISCSTGLFCFGNLKF